MTTDASNTQTYEFKAEVIQLLDILVHSLYTNREIFLRELVSNASDALDKIRYQAAAGAEVQDPGLPLEIRISVDPDQKLLAIEDTGVGMTRDEVIANIGTIAKSGSAEFLKQAAQKGEKLEALIGKFGVGFYSVFMAAENVVIKTRSFLPDQPPVMWRSDGLGDFEVGELEEERPRGTRVEVHLKEDAQSFADKNQVKDIIKRHSNFISFPIYVDGDQVNTIQAVWREPKSNVTREQYNEFYKFLTYDQEDPLEVIHASVDAPVQYNALLFIPKHSREWFGAPQERPGLDLYVRRVLIQHGNTDLIPEYLGFVRGVVDSEDLPLNISRETLQENAALNKIANNIVRQVLTQLQKTADDDPARYEEFWREHGRIFKMGYGDFAHREKWAELLRFNSSKAEDDQTLVSLNQYTQRVKPEQKSIFYVFGQSRQAIELNPHMEIFKSKGLEVLYLYDPVDEFAMESLGQYKEFNIKSVEHTDPADLEQFETQTDKQAPEPLSDDDEKDFDKFLGHIQDVLGDRVTKVKVSNRLTESPSCLVNPDGGLTSSMQKILQIVHKDETIPPKIMEVNQDHRLIRNLFTIFKDNPHDEYLNQAVEQLFESSLLLEGYLKDPHALVNRIQTILDKSSAWRLALKG